MESRKRPDQAKVSTPQGKPRWASHLWQKRIKRLAISNQSLVSIGTMLRPLGVRVVNDDISATMILHVWHVEHEYTPPPPLPPNTTMVLSAFHGSVCGLHRSADSAGESTNNKMLKYLEEAVLPRGRAFQRSRRET